MTEKVGLMFHDIIEVGPQGTLMEGDGAIARASTRQVVDDKLINHVNVHAIPSARESAQWSNALQELAATTPHSVPVTVSSDPRHTSRPMPAPPSPRCDVRVAGTLGLGALRDSERIREFRRHRPSGVRRGRDPVRPARR